jgi:carboxypeptidase family protein/TonB-dependent receptor-like protein
MRMKLLTALVATMFFSPPPALAQLGQTATLTGTVSDASGAILPGVTVTVSSESLIGGSRTAVTDENGVYRFPSLPPGAYEVKFELAGFRLVSREARLELGQTITSDAKLEIGGVQENVTVLGETPVVDVKSSSAQKNLGSDFLQQIPISTRFGPGAMLLAPGVNPTNYSSYGSGGSSSNAYLIDGVDVSDPEGGTIWVFANANWLQEVQVVGLGASAEYGGFSGVASNSLFRSGSNAFHGLFETLYENDWLTGSNTSAEVLALNPDLVAAKTDYVTDTTAQIGGPIKRDKLWFFTSFQYYRPKTAPSGYPPVNPAGIPDVNVGPDARLEKSPRFLFKPTIKLGNNDQLTGFFQAERYDIDGRGSGATVAPEATVREDSKGFAWNGNYTKVLSQSSVFDIRYAGFWGYYYLKPYNGDTPGWYDVDYDFYGVNSYYYYNADRTRHQVNASVTKYASGFAGEHNLKFGAEFERGYVKTSEGYNGGMYVFSYTGVPEYAYIWDGYVKDNVNTRYAFFAQDSWTVGSRLTINPGVRFDMHRGFNRHLDDTVFKTNPISPRIGFAWDVTGKGRTVVRGHYGWYYDGAKSSYYDLLDPQINPLYGAYIDDHLNITSPLYPLDPGTSRTMDPDIKHPRLKQGIIGIEHELVPRFSIGANMIFRDNDQFIDDVLIFQPGDFTTRVVSDPGPDGTSGTADDNPSNTITTYRQLTDPIDNQYLITNPPGAFRRYRGLELTANKRMSNRWQMQASWVISKITGNYNNTSSFGNGTEYDEPNLDPRFQPYREGRLTNDNTHIAKVLGTYQGPWDVLMSGAFYYTSGQTFARTLRVTLPQGRKDLFIEPRGDQRLDAQTRFDIRLEKQFRLTSNQRLGLSLEGFNLFNRDAITTRTTRSGSSYFTPTGLQAPRRFRLGAVLRF